ncbi:MAG: ATP-NAD kinase family protein [Ketobacteraceae bacterium]|nr:ATP-NAD kinase family protein [Ketobacteraceae bacterium]
MEKFQIGLVINPFAGIGGAVGLKGSDGNEVVEKALALGAEKRAVHRVNQVLQRLLPLRDKIRFLAAPGDMGTTPCESLGFECQTVGSLADPERTTAADTERCVRDIAAIGVQLLVFAGGDGTARNIVNSVPAKQLCLGIPAGVKIHSGVYAVNVHGAAEIITQLVNGQLVSVAENEVRDIDEAAFRQSVVKARYYGELVTPVEHRYLQHVKCGGREVEALVLEEIAAGLIEQMDEETLYVMGPGTTTGAVMDAMGLPNTLLGVDLVKDQALVASDVSEQELLEATRGVPARIVVTLIGGQGHILGRGNHQISPRVLRQVGPENLIVIATKSKLEALQGRPLLVDTYDEALNESLAGLTEVITGYEDRVAYRVSY